MEFATTNREEVRNLAEALLIQSENAETIEAKRRFDEDLEQAVNYYTALAKTECYNAAKASENPMHFALQTWAYPSIKVKETKNKDLGVIVRSIEDCEKPIDLRNLHQKIGGIGANHNWIYQAEKFNYFLTVRAASRMNDKVMSTLLKNVETYNMNQVSRDIDLGKNPCSDKNMLATLQSIVDSMLGEGYTANISDVYYLMDCYATDNKKSRTSISAANHKTLIGYLKKVCRRILTNADGYEVEVRELAKDK